jgi:hypothetical protein
VKDGPCCFDQGGHNREKLEMKPPLQNPFIFMMLVAVLVTACATTELISVWKDPSYQQHPSRIMVIGIVKSPATRRIFEDEFVRQLTAHGSKAIASYSEFPDTQQGNDAAIAAKVKQMGVDTVLITRLVSKKTVQVYVPGTPYYPPPYYGTWPDYYRYGHQTMYTPDRIVEDEYAVIETNLYEANNNKLIWTASSQTELGSSNQDLIEPYVSVMVKSMIEQGLLSR